MSKQEERLDAKGRGFRLSRKIAPEGNSSWGREGNIASIYESLVREDLLDVRRASLPSGRGIVGGMGTCKTQRREGHSNQMFLR